MKEKVVFNNSRHILEHTYYTHNLQDVAEPQLFREIFEYGQIPKITFNFRTVPMNTPERIWITDTTFRDGQQSHAPFTVKQIAEIYKMLSRLGGEQGIIRQSEFFLYSERDREAVRTCQELGLRFPEVTSWIRATEADFKLVKAMNMRETGILVSCSDYHIFKKMGLTRRQAADKYLKIVRAALDAGIRPRCHFEDVTRADFYGFVVPLASELKKLMDESGIPIKIRLCDTLGYGLNFNGVSLPRSVQGIVYGINHYADYPSELLEWHGHNDFYKVVANSTAAWLYGCSAVNCSVFGMGERTGNCPLEAMAVEYASIKGTTDGMDLTVITELAEYFEKEIGYEIPPMTPFAGKNFNTTRAGIHADGMLKDQEIYNIFDTEKILNRPPLVAVDAHSGLAGIAFWLNAFFSLPEGEKVAKNDPLVAELKKTVDLQYEDGRVACMGDEEIINMLRAIDPARLEKMRRSEKVF